jgi:hypothetical protein
MDFGSAKLLDFLAVSTKPDYGISEEIRALPLRRKELYNPVVLNSGLNEAAQRLLQLKRGKVYVQDAPVKEAGQVGAA